MCHFLELLFSGVLFWIFLFTWNFLNVVRWINGLLLVESQARDAEHALNSNGNNPEKMKIFKGAGPLPGSLEYVTVLWSFVA